MDAYFRTYDVPFPTIRKAPASVLDYTRDWGEWLAPDEQITSTIVTVAEGITADSTAISLDKTMVTVWLSGGTAGVDYEVLFSIVTNQGRDDSRTIVVRVEQR